MPEKTAKKGDRVTVDYWGTLDDGTQFDASEGKEPLEFRVGGGEMIEGFDKGVIGMKPGETKKIKITAGEAYGSRDENMVVPVQLEKLKNAGINPAKGMMINAGGQMGKVIAVGKNEVTMDFNHPLAGKALNFKIKLIKVK